MDSPISADALGLWVKLCSDFSSVTKYTLSSLIFLEEAPAKLIAICGASKQAYGFVGYAIKGQSLPFLKVKVAPLSSRTLPTLELLLTILLALN